MSLVNKALGALCKVARIAEPVTSKVAAQYKGYLSKPGVAEFIVRDEAQLSKIQKQFFYSNLARWVFRLLTPKKEENQP